MSTSPATTETIVVSHALPAPPLAERIFTLTDADLGWPFEGGAQFLVKPRAAGAFAAHLQVDPFPCYSHNADLVAETAALVESRFPIACPPNYYLLSREETSRTNGHASYSFDYDDDNDVYKREGRYPIEPRIVLSGKRIPLHPGVTRYLVAHEYGHCVDYWICWNRNLMSQGVTDFDREYAEMRGVEAAGGYGGLKWHANIGELIANDFRICVCGVEREFWPHPGFAHPDTMPEIGAFWQRLIAEFAHYEVPDRALA